MQAGLFRSVKAIGAAATLATAFFPSPARAESNVVEKPSLTFATSNSQTYLEDKLRKNHAATTSIRTLSDAKKFVELMQIPDQLQGPTPEQVFNRARKINALSVADVTDSWAYEHIGIRKYFKDIITDEKLAALASDTIPDIRLASLASDKVGIRLFALIKWVEINSRDLPKIDTGKDSYKDFRLGEMIWGSSWQIAQYSCWESDPILKKAQNRELEIPGLPSKNRDFTKEFEEYDILRARSNVLGQYHDLRGRAIDLHGKSLGAKMTLIEIQHEEQSKAFWSKVKVVGWVVGGVIAFFAPIITFSHLSERRKFREQARNLGRLGFSQPNPKPPPNL